MTFAAVTHAAVVERAGRRDAILAVKGGRVVLDSTHAPHVKVDLEVAVPANWAPLKPNRGGHWEPTGAEQLPFIPESGAPPFYISPSPFRWVEDDPEWWNPPVEDEPEPEEPELDIRPFFGGPDDDYLVYISPAARIPVIPPPAPADLRDIDPREAPHVHVVSSWTDAFGLEHSRVFEVTLTGRSIDQETCTIRLTLASDEALLDTYAPLADQNLVMLASSVADICEHVVTLALGEHTAAWGRTADLTPRWSAVNLLRNSTARTSTTGWEPTGGTIAWVGPGGVDGTTGFARVTHTATTGRIVIEAVEAAEASPGRRYTFGASHRSTDDVTVRFGVEFRDEAGTTLHTSTSDDNPAWTSWAAWWFTSAPAPAGTTRVVPFIEWAESATGRVLDLDHAVLAEGEFWPGWFDGHQPATDTYTYSFTRDPDLSPSRRTLMVDAPDPDAFVWRAGTSALDFLHPLVQSAGLRLICDETRTWSLRPADWAASIEPVTVAYAVNMTAGTDEITRDDDTWFDAAIARYRWTMNGIQHERLDTHALPGYTRARLFEINTPYPGPGFAEYAVTRAQGRGREVTVTAQADWTIRAETPVVAVLNGAPPQHGIAATVTYDLDRNEMTITTHTRDE